MELVQFKNPSFQPLGKQAVLITWEEIIDEKLLLYILNLKNQIQEFYTELKIELIHTYNSILINYTYTIEDVYGEISQLKKLLSKKTKTSFLTRKKISVPVCYDQKFGFDLGEISKQNQLSENEIIQLHSSPEYLVYFIGFLPGFLYLGGLEEKLFIDRKKSPRLSIEKGSVGIGGKQTGIYPQKSAGGWQIIGNSPLQFFNSKENISTVFQAGDKVKFHSVSIEEYQKIGEEVKAGTYQIQTEKYEFRGN